MLLPEGRATAPLSRSGSSWGSTGCRRCAAAADRRRRRSTRSGRCLRCRLHRAGDGTIGSPERWHRAWAPRRPAELLRPVHSPVAPQTMAAAGAPSSTASTVGISWTCPRPGPWPSSGEIDEVVPLRSRGRTAARSGVGSGDHEPKPLHPGAAARRSDQTREPILAVGGDRRLRRGARAPASPAGSDRAGAPRRGARR